MRWAIMFALLAGCFGNRGVGVDDTFEPKSSTAKFNAFGLGYFEGLTLGLSNVVFGEAGTRDQREHARADRVANPGWDWFGRVCGFASLIAIGWRVYARRKK